MDDAFEYITQVESLYEQTRAAVGDLDLKWFAEHPEVRERIRRYVPGEFESSGGNVMLAPGQLLVVRVWSNGVTSPLHVGSFASDEWDLGTVS